MEGIGKILVIVGIICVAVGLLWQYVGKIPGDIVIKREHTTIFIPIGTCIVISVVLSLVFYIIEKFR